MIQQNTSVEILGPWFGRMEQNISESTSCLPLADPVVKADGWKPVGLIWSGSWRDPTCWDKRNSTRVTANLFQEAAYIETKPDMEKEKKKRQTTATTKVQNRKPGLGKLFCLIASLRYYNLVGTKTKSLCGDELRTMCFIQQATGKKGLHSWSSISWSLKPQFSASA